MRKPFDVLAEGLDLKNSRETRTPVELFMEGIATLDPATRRLLMAA
jgi:hypothetical protein